MQDRSAPALGPRYWTGLLLASVFGTNMGDFVSDVLHLGHLRGIPILLVALGAVIAAEGCLGGGELFYWSAVILVRTTATNFSDLSTHDFQLSYLLFIGILTVLITLLANVGKFLSQRPSPGGEIRIRPATDLRYWIMMLVAGVLGTAIGDFVDDDLGVGTGPGTLLLGTAFVASLLLRRQLSMTAGYWVVVVAARTTGTAIGDFFSGNGGLNLGLPSSTLLTGFVFAGTLLLWRSRGSVGFWQSRQSRISRRLVLLPDRVKRLATADVSIKCDSHSDHKIDVYPDEMSHLA